MPHATATVNGIVVAETDSYEVVDGNIYFPPNTITKSHFTPTPTKTHCPYKGDASYYTVTTNKTEVKDAAWYYADPLPDMSRIKGFVAFYKGKADVQSS
ncbi:Nn.00g000760.m01.CDS01 [Neocucurbitaria sp. VM-36]